MTLSCVIIDSSGYIRWVEVNGGCFTVIDICTTVMLQLLTYIVPSVVVQVIPVHQVSEDMRRTRRRFCCQVKLITVGYTQVV